MVWVTLKEKKNKREKKSEKKSFMSNDSHRFWEHPTFQMCIFQLFLLSDRTGGDTFVLKMLDELQSSSLSQFYVLHPTEWGIFLLLHPGVVQFTQTLCISRSRKNWSQQRNSSRAQMKELSTVIWSWGWGRVKEKLKRESAVNPSSLTK